MKRLLLMRHAKSSWTQGGLTDFDRPLKPRGETASLLMGRLLQLNDLTPAHILSSNAERAQATARLILTQFSPAPTLELTDDLYHASSRTLVSCIRETDDRHDSLLLIAHNPGLEELIYHWTSEFVAFPTAAIAMFQWPVDRWSQVDLQTSIAYDQLWKPKELDPESLEQSSPQE